MTTLDTTALMSEHEINTDRVRRPLACQPAIQEAGIAYVRACAHACSPTREVAGRFCTFCSLQVLRKNQGMRHMEGGWPENVDASEADQVDRYLKRANKVRNVLCL